MNNKESENIYTTLFFNLRFYVGHAFVDKDGENHL